MLLTARSVLPRSVLNHGMMIETEGCCAGIDDPFPEGIDGILGRTTRARMCRPRGRPVRRAPTASDTNDAPFLDVLTAAWDASDAERQLALLVVQMCESPPMRYRLDL